MDLAFDTRGDGRPIVCLPWFGTGRSMLAAAFEPAFDGRTGWRRVYVDLPGCGDSPADDVPATSSGVVDAVSAFIDDHLGSEPFLLAGCSYGGYLSAAIARRRPADVNGMLLVCPGVKIMPADRDLPAAPAAGADQLADPGWLDAVPADLHGYLELALGNRARAVAERVAAEIRAGGAGDQAYLNRLRSAGYQLPDEDSTASYPGPVCIVIGHEDWIAGYADQLRLLRVYPRATAAVLDGVGHYAPFESAGLFRALVADWLDRCGGRPGEHVSIL